MFLIFPFLGKNSFIEPFGPPNFTLFPSCRQTFIDIYVFLVYRADRANRANRARLISAVSTVD